MTSGTYRENSSAVQFRRRVPADIKDRALGKTILVELPGDEKHPTAMASAKAGMFVKFSLRTSDPILASLRLAAANDQVARQFDAFRRGPVALSHRELVAYSGEAYRLYIDKFQENPGSPEGWAALKAFNRAAREGRLLCVPPLQPGENRDQEAAFEAFGANLTDGINSLPEGTIEVPLEARFGLVADWVLAKHGKVIDADCRKRFLKLIDQAVTDAAWTLKRNAQGDYSPDPNAGRFPPIQASHRVSLEELFDRWQRETEPRASTLTTWGGYVPKLAAHVGEKAQDITRITPDDMVAWKDILVGTLSPKTINGGYLGAANALFNYAVANKLLSSNPANGVRVRSRTIAGTSKLPYEDVEVAKLLEIAAKQTAVSRRWLPLMMACTGARVGELTQLWGKCIKEVDGILVIVIKPAEDGGTLKNAGSERTVPLHPALIEAGFLEFVRAKGDGPLFYRRSSGKPTKRHASTGVRNRLGEWIRSEGFTDPRKAPSHALRHWFKSVCVKAGVSDSMADAIQGHRDNSAAGTYRHFTLEGMAEAVAKIEIPSW